MSVSVALLFAVFGSSTPLGALTVAVFEIELIARDTPRLLGAQLDLSALTAPRLDALLFGEAQGRIVISVAPHNAAKVLAQAKILEISATRLGAVGGSQLQTKTASGELTWGLPELHDLWWNSIARAMK